MQHDFNARLCTHDELGPLIDFAKRMRKENAVDFLPQEENLFINKYRSDKKGTPHLNLFVLRDKDAIIGCSGYIPFKGMMNAAKLDGFIAEDAFIDPTYRRELPGLVPFFARSYETLIRKDKLFPLICPVNDVRSQDFKRVRWGQFCHIYKLSSFSAAKLSSDFKSSSVTLRKIEHFDSDMAAFFKRIAPQHYFILNADVEFLNWKYFKNPCSTYVILVATKGKNIVGYIIVEQRQSDVYIVDITVDLEYPHVIVLLIYNALKYCKEREVALTVGYLSHARYIEVLKKVGFSVMAEIECLFFKVTLLWSKQIKQDEFYSSDKDLYHFNGFVPQIY